MPEPEYEVRGDKGQFPCHLFQLTKSDFRILKSQIVTSKPIERRGGTQKPPYAFTRNGIGMLSSVLRSGYVAPLHHTSLGCFLAKRGFFDFVENTFARIKK